MSELYERFERLHRDSPGRPLVYRAVAGDVVTVDDLAILARQVRGSLLKAGTASGLPVISVAGNTITAISTLLACLDLGIPLLPVDKSASSAEIGAIAARFGSRLLIGASGLTGVPTSLATPLADGLNLMVISGRPAAPIEALPDVAVMKLTSGSTGEPRATLTTAANVVADAAAIIESMDIRVHDVQLAAIPISHAYGLGNLIVPLLFQGTAIVLRDGFVPHQFAHDATRYGITMFPGVPFMFDHLLKHLRPEMWPASLTRLITAGARIEPATVARFHDRFGRKVHSFYGTSETGGICYDDGEEVDAEPTVGRPMPNVTITLRADDDAPPRAGRVHVAGPAVALGYASGTGAAAVIEDSPFIDEGFLTGDLGRFNDRDHLELHGRVSSFVNVAGRKVQPQEVEGVLRTAPGLIDVRVVGAADSLRGQQLVACVVLADRATTAAVLRSYCSARLAPFKIPRQFIFMDQIPLTGRGKTDRATLEAIVTRHLASSR